MIRRPNHSAILSNTLSPIVTFQVGRSIKKLAFMRKISRFLISESPFHYDLSGFSVVANLNFSILELKLDLDCFGN